MTARELAHGLRTLRQTNDVAALYALVQRAPLPPDGALDDATDTLLWEIASKLVRLERQN